MRRDRWCDDVLNVVRVPGEFKGDAVEEYVHFRLNVGNFFYYLSEFYVYNN